MSRLLAAAILLLAFLLASPSLAASELRLEAGRREHLLGLETLRNALNAEDLEGRVLVLAFFASWCPPCHPEMAALNRLRDSEDEAGLTIVAANLFETWGGLSDEAGLERFLEQYQPAYPVVRATEETAALFGGVDRIPTLFVFAPDGTPALHFIHRRGAEKSHVAFEELEAAVRAAGR